VMRHCRQCRADAVGLLGEDRGHEFTLDRLPEKVAYDPSKRQAYRVIVARERDDHMTAKRDARASLGAADSGARILVAVATRGGGRVNQHFGHAREFQVYQASASGVQFVGHRKVDDVFCQGGFGEDATLAGIIRALDGIEVVLCAKIGDCPTDELEAAGIGASDAWAYEYIETAISAYYARVYGVTPQAMRA
jgi:nitrogen fixation protein NifB